MELVSVFNAATTHHVMQDAYEIGFINHQDSEKSWYNRGRILFEN